MAGLGDRQWLEVLPVRGTAAGIWCLAAIVPAGRGAYPSRTCSLLVHQGRNQWPRGPPSGPLTRQGGTGRRSDATASQRIRRRAGGTGGRSCDRRYRISRRFEAGRVHFQRTAREYCVGGGDAGIVVSVRVLGSRSVLCGRAIGEHFWTPDPVRVWGRFRGGACAGAAAGGAIDTYKGRTSITRPAAALIFIFSRWATRDRLPHEAPGA